MKFKKIMVPVDGSDHSMKAAETAADLVFLTGGEILLVHCHKSFPSVIGEPYPQEAITRIRENSDELMTPYRHLRREKGIGVVERLVEGPPGSVLPEIADIEKCDMIVMGSRGRTDLQGLFLGSVTHRVLRSTPCPVLVVR